MALGRRFDVLTSPGATGSQAISGLGFAPKIVFLWSAYQTAAALTGGNIIWSHGAGTQDGGTVQQVCASVSSLDGNNSGQPSGVIATDAVLIGLTPSTTATAEDYQVELTSLDSDGFTLNWSNLPATASIKVFYLALGGTDVTSARAFSWNGNNGATQDVTINAGFGQPDLVLLLGGSEGGIAASSGAFNSGLGAFTSDTDERSSWLWWEDAVDPNVFGRQGSDIWVGRGVGAAGSGVVGQAAINARASWPTDGFQVAYSNPTPGSFVGAAIKGTFQKKIGTISSSTTLNATTTHNAGFTPEAALLFGLNMPSSGADISADNTALLGAFGIGGWDGTREGFDAYSQDDAATTDQGGRVHDETKAWLGVDAGATPTKAADADASVSGNNFQLTWTDPDTVVREINGIFLASAAGGGAVQVDPAFQTHTRQQFAIKTNPKLPLALQTHTRQQFAITAQELFTLLPALQTHTRQQFAIKISPKLVPQLQTHTRQQFALVVHPEVVPTLQTHTRQQFAITVGAFTILPLERIDHTRVQHALMVHPQLVPARVDHTRQIFAVTVTTGIILQPSRNEHLRDQYLLVIHPKLPMQRIDHTRAQYQPSVGQPPPPDERLRWIPTIPTLPEGADT